jgi:tRNA(adenine34) deaminase
VTGDELRLESDQCYMRVALEQARAAEAAGEVPVGAVLVIDGRILARAHNSPILRSDPTAHAEMLVLREAAGALNNYRLQHAILYVNMEPCVMCAGALINARIERLVFACRDLRFGAVRSKFRLADSDLLNHRLEITEGVLGAEATELVQRFFAARRNP